MKKVICLVILLATCLFFTLPSLAATAPQYIPEYDMGAGAFFANGTPIEINENATGGTVITWEGGSQVVPSTVTVYGGGSNGTSFTDSSITMNGGTVSNLVAGGESSEEDNPATVTNGNIVMNNGTVLGNIVGGGFGFTTVSNSNIIMNGGKTGVITGGGFANVVINGVLISAGTEDNLQGSKNRVDNVNITINDGEIKSETLSYGTLYGGGQGYSYVGDTNITINGGDLSKAYVTAGGSNGYTGESNVKVNGGTINIYQSTNRGVVDDATLTMTDGTINNLYVGGETGDDEVTGIINNSEVNLLGGNIGTLEPGKSNSQPITINNRDYSVVKTLDVTIENDNIPSGEVEVSYDISVIPNEVELSPGQSEKLNAIIKTTPAGYEYLFADNVKWESSNNNIATVSDKGTLTAVSEGTTTVTATLFDKQESASVIVNDTNILLMLLWIIIPLALFLIIFGLLIITEIL